MFPAIFLDRDGVIIENRSNYVRSWADVTFLPGAVAGLIQLKCSPYKVIIITNQSVVGRNIISLQQAEEINQKLVDTITKSGGQIDGVFMCPHAPEDNCDCRKPKPGLLFKAAKALTLDLTRSIMIGDALSDMMAGQAAGIPQNALVMTGRGKEQIVLPESTTLKPFLYYPDLLTALKHLLPGHPA